MRKETSQKDIKKTKDAPILSLKTPFSSGYNLVNSQQLTLLLVRAAKGIPEGLIKKN